SRSASTSGSAFSWTRRLAEVWRMKQGRPAVLGPGGGTLSPSTKSVPSRVMSWSPRPRVETVMVCDWGSIESPAAFTSWRIRRKGRSRTTPSRPTSDRSRAMYAQVRPVPGSAREVRAHVVLVALAERLRGGLHLGGGLLRHLHAELVVEVAAPV